jgi:hypothetical protein
MEQSKIDKLNTIIPEYNQYKQCQLQIDIDSVLDCGNVRAFNLGKSHCNLISFWACNVAAGKTDISYVDFFGKLIKNSLCEPNGKLLINKELLCRDIFGFDFTIKYFQDFEDVLNPFRLDMNKFYQMRIINTSHFISCYIELEDKKPVMMLSDTNDRGIGVKAEGCKRINPKYFSWLLEI